MKRGLRPPFFVVCFEPMSNTKTIGILKLNTRFPRLVGDIGNPATFRYPVMYQTVQSATAPNITIAETLPQALQNDFITATHELIKHRVSVITTTCGFLSTMQDTLSSLHRTPVICSSLSLLPLLASIHGGADKLGVLTFNPQTLNSAHFSDVAPGSIEGLLADDTLRQVIANDHTELDRDKALQEVLLASDRLIHKHPNVRGIVLECTNLSPYKNEIREQSGLAVYDIVDAIHWLLDSQAIG